MMGFNSSTEYEAWIEDGIRRGLDVASLQLDLLTLPTGCILSSFLDDFIDDHPESLKPHSCQRQFEIVRKRRRNFVVFRWGG